MLVAENKLFVPVNFSSPQKNNGSFLTVVVLVLVATATGSSSNRRSSNNWLYCHDVKCLHIAKAWHPLTLQISVTVTKVTHAG